MQLSGSDAELDALFERYAHCMIKTSGGMWGFR